MQNSIITRIKLWANLNTKKITVWLGLGFGVASIIAITAPIVINNQKLDLQKQLEDQNQATLNKTIAKVEMSQAWFTYVESLPDKNIAAMDTAIATFIDANFEQALGWIDVFNANETKLEDAIKSFTIAPLIANSQVVEEHEWAKFTSSLNVVFKSDYLIDSNLFTDPILVITSQPVVEPE